MYFMSKTWGIWHFVQLEYVVQLLHRFHLYSTGRKGIFLAIGVYKNTWKVSVILSKNHDNESGRRAHHVVKVVCKRDQRQTW